MFYSRNKFRVYRDYDTVDIVETTKILNEVIKNLFVHVCQPLYIGEYEGKKNLVEYECPIHVVPYAFWQTEPVR